MKTCVIIGASHGGVNCAFALRREGWEGEIILFDTDPLLPYHRPPLSKTYLTAAEGSEQTVLKTAESYEKENITLRLGIKVESINRLARNITLSDGSVQSYDKLVLATGARPFIPPIEGMDTAINLFPMRTAADAINIRKTFQNLKNKRVVVIGGGYIGLETAASLRKLGATITVLEREDRILARVTAPVLSDFFYQLHTQHGVDIFNNKNVSEIRNDGKSNTVICTDGSSYAADLIVVGVGIRVNIELAQAAGLTIENGIKVDAATQTSDENIYAIGDCTYHHNPHYDRWLRLESVQNANDQAKIAAAAICDKTATYDTIPWFWSDQYDVKLQIVGWSAGYTDLVVREELDKDDSFSIWYFKGDELLAVDAINNGKAYILGTKFIKSRQLVDKTQLADSSVVFKPDNMLL